MFGSNTTRRLAITLVGFTLMGAGQNCLAWTQTNLPTSPDSGSAASFRSEPVQRVVLVRDLQPVTLGNFPPDLTSDGRWLAYEVIDSTSQAERIVCVQNMVSGLTRCLTDRTSKDGWAAAPRWSPDGRWLAFFVRRNAKPMLALWERERDRTVIALEAPTPESRMNVSWNESGSAVFAVTETPALAVPSAANDKPNASSPAVTVWRSAAAKAADARRERQAAGFELHSDAVAFEGVESVDQQRPTYDVWEVSVGSTVSPASRWIMRGRAVEQIAASPDGRWLAVFGNRRTQMQAGNSLSPSVDLYLVPLTGGYAEAAPDGSVTAIWTNAQGQVLSPVLTSIPQDGSRSRSLTWAPDSHAVAYVTAGRFGNGDVFIVSASSAPGKASVRNISQAASVQPLREFTETDDRERYKRFAYGNRELGGGALWTADSQAIIRAGGGDIWYLPAEGGAEPRNLTADDSQRHFTSVLGLVKPGGIRQVAGDQRSVLVHAIETTTLREGVWRVRLSDGGQTLVVDGEQQLAIGNGAGDVAESTQRIVTGVSAFNIPQELWTVSGADGSRLQRLTSWNGDNAAFLQKLRRRDLRWATADGAARGILILPEPQSPSSRLPVLIHGYPGAAWASKNLHRFGVNQAFEPFAYLSRGYAVFVMDIPFIDRGSFGTDGPMKPAVDAVEAGVVALVATGLVDEKRIVPHSFSYGGQLVNSLLARSAQFAAGIAGAGVSNLVSAAGTGFYGMTYYETGQGRMGATVWDEPQRYVANSPVFYLNRVTAPLLLYHGEKDNIVSIGQAEEMYRGLARLSRDVTLLRYRDVGHGFNTTEVTRDLWSRILDWLDARLATPSSP